MASKQFVREEKKEREQVCVEQTWCVPAAHTQPMSGGQDPTSDETERAELSPKVTGAGDFRPTKGQRPGLKKMQEGNIFLCYKTEILRK